MPRPPRPLIAGGVYHVFNRGVARLPIYVDTRDRVGFLDLLADVVDRCSWECLVYCLMGNHFHLLVETPERRSRSRHAAASGRVRAALQPPLRA